MFSGETQMTFVEKNTIMSKMENTFAGYLAKLDLLEETSSNLEDIRIEIVQNKTQRNKNGKSMYVNCSMTTLSALMQMALDN